MAEDAFIEFVRLVPPAWLPAIGITAIVVFGAIKIFPVIVEAIEHKDERHERETKARIEIEMRREERKAKEGISRELRDRERSENEGRWLAQYEHATNVQEQTNVVIEGVREQMHILNTTLLDSKERSREMAKKVDDIHKNIL